VGAIIVALWGGAYLTDIVGALGEYVGRRRRDGDGP
jgi:hypothetical protein